MAIPDQEPGLKNLINSGGVVTFLKATLQKTASRSVDDYGSTITETINMKYVKDFVDPDRVNHAVKSIDVSTLDECGVAVVTAWNEALDGTKSRKPDHGTWDFEDEE